ncbi:helix-turn-helix domain-containing protein [Rhodobacteraceae bacterium 2CG4]|uniref:Helix-turn-helix domain-containing protein n=1 Tax=Halovulum marinum TaxID=2662447 RepID=A0A6L5YY89_9RHOB|nr:IclR family transcriptional regulator [Halovulum marinum]MSU88900.1 helix-turn-helix domain-containing protein [Halovulum marinum]
MATGDGTVGKALEVLDRVAGFGRPVRFSELLAGSPYPKATLYRLLQTLVHQRMLTYDADRAAYAPGIRLVRLAHNAWTHSTLAPIARQHLDALAAEIGETVHLAQLDHAQVLYVDKRSSAVPVEMISQTGKVGPAYCTGIGKAMLAFLPLDLLDWVLSQQSFHAFTAATITSERALRRELEQIRAEGHAFDREEHEPGIICIAAPILTPKGGLLGGLSVTSTTRRRDLDDLAPLAPRLKATAVRIAADAESWHFPDQTPKPLPGRTGT